MGLFRFFQPKANEQNKFVSNEEFKLNLTKQITMTPQTLQQLRKYGIGETKELKLEYFFYTNTVEKAKNLAREIERMNYEVDFKKAAGDSSQFIISGWSTKMKMSETIVGAWTKQMCELGYQFDCDFDGWGTNPTQ